jgi:hypothetical protein
MLIVQLFSLLLGAGELLFGWFGLIPPILGIIGVSKLQGVVLELLPEEATPRSDSAEQPRQHPVPAPELEKKRPGSAPEAAESTGRLALDQRKKDARLAREGKKVSLPIAPEGKDVSLIEGIDWEQWIGKKLLQKVGILIVLIGMIVFLKYSFDNHLIGELGRIALSTFAALALLVAGEWFHKKYFHWSQAFTGAGLALLYFTVWAAHVYYHEALLAQHGISISPALAMILYSFITAVGAAASIRYKAQTIAWFTLVGGYLTPLLISLPTLHFITLVIYLAILTAGVLCLSWYRSWPAITIVSFLVTQLYLFNSIYPALGVSDFQQAIIAIGFFILFAVPPLLSQFGMGRDAKADDIFLILLDGAVVFFPILDVCGGYGGDYVGLVLLGLAAVYIVFASMALLRRPKDSLLVNAYLLAGIGLTSLALLAQMEWRWVAAGWAPFSVLLLSVALFLKRKSVFGCASALLAGSMFFLILNLPLSPESELWHPFTSHWALLSYVVFASVLGWIFLTRSLPKELYPSDEFELQLPSTLHFALAIILFAAVTFEATGLQWAITLPLAFSYLAFTAVAIALYALTGMTIWFVAAILVQCLVLLFTFLFGDTSGLVFGHSVVVPFFHPWSGVSVLSFAMLFASLFVVMQRKESWLNTLSTRALLITVACAQVWLHVTIELSHLRETLVWSPTLYTRILSGWWILFSIPFFVLGIRKSRVALRNWGIILLTIPFLKDFFLIASRQQTSLYELGLWTAIPLALLVLSRSFKDRSLLQTGIIMLLVTMAADFLNRIGVVGFLPTAWWTLIAFVVLAIGLQGKQRILLSAGIFMIVVAILFDQLHVTYGSAGFVRTVWWTCVGLIVITPGFLMREKLLRQFAICIFGAATIKLLVLDFAMLTTGVRIGASIVTGLLLIGASYLYQRFDSILFEKK